VKQQEGSFFSTEVGLMEELEMGGEKEVGGEGGGEVVEGGEKEVVGGSGEDEVVGEDER